MSINLVVLLSIVTEWPSGSTSECGEKIQVRASAVSFMTAAAIRSLGHGLQYYTVYTFTAFGHPSDGKRVKHFGLSNNNKWRR